MMMRGRNMAAWRITVLSVICFLFFGFLGSHPMAQAAVPNSIIGYQGRLLNTSGAPVADASLTMIFRFYDASSGGTCLWSNSSTSCASATGRTVTLTDGLFSENLGETGAGYAAIPDALFRDGATVYLQVDVAGETLTPRKLLTSAPYAINARFFNGMDSSAFLLWTDGGATTYLTSTTDDFAIGGTALSGSAFSVDVSANTATLGSGATSNGVLVFNASDGDTGNLTYSTDDALHVQGGNLTLDQNLAVNGGTISMSGTTANYIVGNTGTFTFSDGTNTLFSIADGGTSGNATITGTLQVNGNAINGNSGALVIGNGTTTYVGIGSGTPGIVAGAGDLYVTDGVEIDGTLDGTSSVFTGSVTATSFLCTDCITLDQIGDTLTLDADLQLLSSAGRDLTINIGASGGGGNLFIRNGTGTFATFADNQTISISSNATSATVFSLDPTSVTTGRVMYVRGLGVTTGTVLTVDGNSAGLTSGDVINAIHQPTYNTSQTISGNVADISRSLTSNSGANLTVTGDTLNLSSAMTVTSGSITDSSSVLSVTQLYGSATGAVVDISTLGAGIGLRVVQNGVDAPSSGSTSQQAVVIDVDEAVGDNAADEDVMIIRSDADGTPDTEFRFQLDGDALADGAFTGGGADFAEFFLTRDVNLVDSDVVCRDPLVANAVKRCEAGNHDVIGVVSPNPSFIGNNIPGAERDLRGDPNYRIIGMLGQIATKATAVDGPIAIGDPITTSSTVAGYAGKAHGPVQIIGRALEALPSGTGMIKVHVTPSWYAGDVFSDNDATTLVSDDIALAALTTATAGAPTSDSHALALRGSAWNNGAAETREMVLLADVSGADDYGISVRNNVGDQVAHIDQDGDLALAGRLYPSDRGQLQTEKYIYYDSSSGDGYMRTNAAGWATGSYDFAEMFPSTQALAAGEVVIFASDNEHVQRSSGTPYDEGIAGIISTRPGFLAGENESGNVPVALAGRVPTYVSGENGAITVGDPLTTSTRPGYAMKATEAGPIVGYAMEPFSGTTGVIIVVVRPSYYDGGPVPEAPEAENTASQLLSVSDLDVTGSLNMNGGRLLAVGSLTGVGNAWRLEENGDFVTIGRIATRIHSSQGEDVSTYAVTSTDTLLQLSGTAILSSGIATVDFETIDPHFNDVIAEGAVYRVFLTPSAPTGQLYAVDRTNQGFEIHEVGGASNGVAVDWMVMAYRKDFAPASALQGPVDNIAPEETPSPAEDEAPDEGADTSEISDDETPENAQAPADTETPSTEEETISSEEEISPTESPSESTDSEDAFTPPPEGEEVVPTPDTVP